MIAFVWAFATTIGVNAQVNQNNHQSIYLEFQDMQGTIDSLFISRLGAQNNTLKLVKRNNNIYSGNIFLSSNEWMTQFVVEASSKNSSNPTKLYIQLSKVGVPIKTIPIYHYSSSDEFQKNAKPDQVLYRIEKSAPKKPLEREKINLNSPKNEFDDLLKLYFQAKFMCNNPNQSWVKGINVRACNAYFNLAYRLADLVGFNKLFIMDQYVMDNWQTFPTSFLKPWNDMGQWLQKLPTNSTFYYCDVTKDALNYDNNSLKLYLQYLRRKFNSLEPDEKEYLKKNSQKCHIIDQW